MKRTRRRFGVKCDPGHYASLPYDMLRYDACWPESQADVHAAEDPGGHRDGDGCTLIALLSDSASEPDSARWASFGWHVMYVEKVRADA